MSSASADARWQRIRALFHQALDQPAATRAAWVHAQCADDPAAQAELEALLAAHGDGSELFAEHASAAILTMADAETPREDLAQRWLGTQLGAYRLSKLLGQGGMGLVFLAERVDGQFQQAVALKLIRGDFEGPEARERFLRERQTLARLQHPNIAQLHEGGLTPDGAPYFTLEYVDGQAITQFCDSRNLGIEARLNLLIKVCDAVQYAHRNLIVHRDIKPSNILVTASGDVKLLDFGIAKSLAVGGGSAATAPQAQLMTREYAAPEQVLAQPITTATDVYSLGVLTYELLSGRLPYARADRGEISWPKAIIDEQPEPLSRAVTRAFDGPTTADTIARARAVPLGALLRRLRGDLDRIVSRALEKLPEARYASVAAFGADLEAVVEGRAPQGSPWRYRALKFVARNRFAMALVGALLVSALAGAIGVVVQQRETQREAERARREAATSAAVTEFLLGVFSAADPRELQDKTLSARELLDRSAARIGGGLTTELLVRVEMQRVLARAYYQLGAYDQAKALQQAAIADLAERPEAVVARATLQRQLAETHARAGDLAAASTLIAQSCARLEPTTDAVEARLRCAATGANIAAQSGQRAEARRYADQALFLAEDPTLAPLALGDIYAQLTYVAVEDEDYPTAERLGREALRLRLLALGESNPTVSTARVILAGVLRVRGKYDEAAELLRNSLATSERVYGPRHATTTGIMNTLGLLAHETGHYQDAERWYRQSVAIKREVGGAQQTSVAFGLNNLAAVELETGNAAAAEGNLVEALQILTALLGADHPRTLVVRTAWAEVRAELGHLDEAEAELKRIIAIDAGKGVHQHLEQDKVLGQIALRRGDWQASAMLYRQALAAAEQQAGAQTREAALSRFALGRALAAGADDVAAEQELRAARAVFQQLFPTNSHPLIASIDLELGQLLLKRDSGRAEGLGLLQEAVRLRSEFLAAEHPLTRAASEALQQASRQ